MMHDALLVLHGAYVVLAAGHVDRAWRTWRLALDYQGEPGYVSRCRDRVVVRCLVNFAFIGLVLSIRALSIR